MTAVDTTKISAVPEHEVAEEGVTLAHSEIVQQGLRDVAGVFEETREPGEHLDDLQRGEVVRLLHVLNTRRQAFLLCRRVEREDREQLVRQKELSEVICCKMGTNKFGFV